MRAIRWNKSYLTGDSILDERNKALVALLTELRDELNRKEHCQDIIEFTSRLADLTKQRLSNLSENSGGLAESDASIQNLLKSGFPLAAQSTQACRECGLCDLVADRIGKWLSEGSSEQDGSST